MAVVIASSAQASALEESLTLVTCGEVIARLLEVDADDLLFLALHFAFAFAFVLVSVARYAIEAVVATHREADVEVVRGQADTCGTSLGLAARVLNGAARFLVLIVLFAFVLCFLERSEER